SGYKLFSSSSSWKALARSGISITRCVATSRASASAGVAASGNSPMRARRARPTIGSQQKEALMKALVYGDPGKRTWTDVPDPTIQEPTDVIVRIDSSTICGTDLHILKGDVPEVKPGTILGHEAVGTIVETGEAVTTLAVGDRVLVSCITSCGR